MIKRILEKMFHLEPEFCASCDMLKQLLEQERRDKHRLLDVALSARENPAPYTPIEIKEENIRSKNVPWSMRRAQLEMQDKLKAETDRKEAKIRQEINDLEKEVNLDEQAS